MPKLTEIDEAVKAWLAGHHIQMKDVRSYEARGAANDFTELTITVIVAGTNEIPTTEAAHLTDFTQQPEQPTETIPAVDPNRWSTDFYPTAPGRNPGGQ